MLIVYVYGRNIALRYGLKYLPKSPEKLILPRAIAIVSVVSLFVDMGHICVM